MKPAGQDNVTGWFVYKCGKGVLLTPTYKCVLPRGCSSGGGTGGGLGFGGDIGAGFGGSYAASRRAGVLTAATGVEVGKALGVLEGLRQDGAINSDYAAAAGRAIARQPDKYIGKTATGEEMAGWLATPAPYALARSTAGASPIAGVHLATPAKGCDCKRVPCDIYASFCIYRCKTGLFYTGGPWCYRPCEAGSPGWWGETWRSVTALFRTPSVPPPADPAKKALEGLGAIKATAATKGTTHDPCVPDIVLARDEGLYGSGWFWVIRNGQKLFVPNPKTCP